MDTKREEPEGESKESDAAPETVRESLRLASGTGRTTTVRPAEVEERRSFRRAMLIGLFVWPAFYFVDVYLGRIVYPGAPLLFFFGLRIVGECAIYGMYRLSYVKEVTSRTLKLSNAVVCGFIAVLIAFMGSSFGGLTSPYLHGTAIVILVLAMAVPAPWRDSIGYVAATALSYPAVTLVLAPQRLSDNHDIALFFGHYVILLGSATVAIVSSHAAYNARQELRRARRLGRYRLEARIGEGGMNEVWLAWDAPLRRNVALKILRSSADTESRALARFEREATALSQLTSPHTVRIFDFGAADDGFSFIAMEYLEGKDLQGLVDAEGPLEPERVVRLGMQACRSLREAHSVGIVHRDVKPANLFVARSLEGRDFLKVLDFGIARIVSDDVTKTQSVRGTPAYMAPECWTNAKVDGRSDLYSLGATLFFMLVGRPPFEGTDLVRAHLAEAPQKPSTVTKTKVPESLDELILMCLAKAPEQRFQSIEELSDALGDCFDEMLGA